MNKSAVIHNPVFCIVHAARSDIQTESSNMQIRVHHKHGFTLVEIMIVVAIIGLLAAIAIPNFVRARTTAQQNACINNLRQIDSAKQQWALETRQATNATPVISDIAPYLGRSGVTSTVAATVVCPAGGATATFASSYNILAVSTAPTCQIIGTAHVLQ